MLVSAINSARMERAVYLKSYIDTQRDKLKIIINGADTASKRRLALVQAMQINAEMKTAADELEALSNV
jgi:hypothetical protein